MQVSSTNIVNGSSSMVSRATGTSMSTLGTAGALNTTSTIACECIYEPGTCKVTGVKLRLTSCSTTTESAVTIIPPGHTGTSSGTVVNQHTDVITGKEITDNGSPVTQTPINFIAGPDIRTKVISSTTAVGMSVGSTLVCKVV